MVEDKKWLQAPLRNLLPLPPIIGLLEGGARCQCLLLLFSVSDVSNLLLALLNFKEKIQGEWGLLCNKYI